MERRKEEKKKGMKEEREERRKEGKKEQWKEERKERRKNGKKKGRKEGRKERRKSARSFPQVRREIVCTWTALHRERGHGANVHMDCTSQGERTWCQCTQILAVSNLPPRKWAVCGQ
ncbi:hypothetical protein ACOMHN_065467 [Nucella lapillus]